MTARQMALLPDDDPVRFWSVRRRGRLVLPRHLDRVVVQATEFQDGQWRAARATTLDFAARSKTAVRTSTSKASKPMNDAYND